jgi:type II secretory pathway component PulF
MELSFDELKGLSDKVAMMFKRFQFGTKKQLAFLEDFWVLINDGIPANRAIDMMTKVSTGLNKEVSLSIAQKIAQGQPLADGMQDWFSPNVVEIVRVGEAGGALSQTIKSAISTLSRRWPILALSSLLPVLSLFIYVALSSCNLSKLNRLINGQMKVSV